LNELQLFALKWKTAKNSDTANQISETLLVLPGIPQHQSVIAHHCSLNYKYPPF